MTCLQDDLCYNWNLGTSPTAAELHYEACPITVNGAPYPRQFGRQEDGPDSAGWGAQALHVENGLYGDVVWYQLHVEAGSTYIIQTRLGSTTFTWLYLLDSDGTTQLASCEYCRPDQHDRSSVVTYTSDDDKTVYIKVHGSEFLGQGFTLTVDCQNCHPVTTCTPLQDPDSDTGGINTSQCRSVPFTETCRVFCDWTLGYTGSAAKFICGADGSWSSSSGFPDCVAQMPNSGDDGSTDASAGGNEVAVVSFVHANVDTVSTSGVPGYTTYRLSLSFTSHDVRNVYALFGSPMEVAGEHAGEPAKPMHIPGAFQAPAPFGSDVGGTNPLFWAHSPVTQYDSWLTIGVIEGDYAGGLSSVGIDFDRWTETVG